MLLWLVRPVAKSAGCKCDFPGELHAGPPKAAGSPTLVMLPSRLVTEMRFSNFRRKAVLMLELSCDDNNHSAVAEKGVQRATPF